jgi:hypothetical protein
MLLGTCMSNCWTKLRNWESWYLIMLDGIALSSIDRIDILTTRPEFEELRIVIRKYHLILQGYFIQCSIFRIT